MERSGIDVSPAERSWMRCRAAMGRGFTVSAIVSAVVAVVRLRWGRLLGFAGDTMHLGMIAVVLSPGSWDLGTRLLLASCRVRMACLFCRAMLHSLHRHVVLHRLQPFQARRARRGQQLLGFTCGGIRAESRAWRRGCHASNGVGCRCRYLRGGH